MMMMMMLLLLIMIMFFIFLSSPPRMVRSAAVRIAIPIHRSHRLQTPKSRQQNRRQTSQLLLLLLLVSISVVVPRTTIPYNYRAIKIRPPTGQPARLHPVFPRRLVVHVHPTRPRARERFIPHQTS
jgi:ABC-type uncharacterized transport system permease subunit